MVYGHYKDEDHNLIAAIESALIDASNSVQLASEHAYALLDRNPDREVQVQELIDELSNLNYDIENTDWGEDLHAMFQKERGEDYWEDKD